MSFGEFGGVSSSRGQFVGDLELVHRIAIGGMAEVWEARHRWSGEQVALKLVMGRAAADPGLRQAMMDEIHIGGLLDHPNIVRLHSLMQKGDAVGIQMDLVEGRDLRKLMSAAMKAKADPPPIDGVLSLGHQATSALAYAHEATDAAGKPLDIIHRDISPQNVLVARDGVVKLLDFGIALARDRVTRTKVGMVKGKLNYMSPEQIMGEPLDVRTDLFALGVMLWESFAMRPLFARAKDEDTVKAIVGGEVARLLDLRPEVPEPIALLVHRLLETKREARPSNAREVLEVLDAFPGRAEVLAAWAMPFQEARHKTMALQAVPRPTPQSPTPQPPAPTKPLQQTEGAAPTANGPQSPAAAPSSTPSPGAAPGSSARRPSPSVAALPGGAASPAPAGALRPWAPSGHTPRPRLLAGAGAGAGGAASAQAGSPSPNGAQTSNVVATAQNGSAPGNISAPTELPKRADLDALTHVGDANTTGPTAPPADPAEPQRLPTSALRIPDANADAFDTTSKGVTPDLGEEPLGASDDDGFGAETRLDRVALGRIEPAGSRTSDDATIGVPVVNAPLSPVPGVRASSEERAHAPSPSALRRSLPPDARIGDAAVENTIVQGTAPSGAFAATYVRAPDETDRPPTESSTATVGEAFVTLPSLEPTIAGPVERLPPDASPANADRTSADPTVGLAPPVVAQLLAAQEPAAPTLHESPPVVIAPVAPSTVGARPAPLILPPEPVTPLYARGWFLALLLATVLLGAAWLWARTAR
jgi:serine/threonine protein kinase